jgi:hypothetical protein
MLGEAIDQYRLFCILPVADSRQRQSVDNPLIQAQL